MKAHRLLFIATLYLTALASFVAFAANVVPWFQFRYSSQAATLLAQPDPIVNGPDDERKLAAEQRARGHAVRLKLASGEMISSYAHLTTEQYKQATSAQGVRVLFRQDGPQRVRVLGDLRELASPWPWLMLAVACSLTAPFARKLYRREQN
jgi:hypothetical protein